MNSSRVTATSAIWKVTYRGVATIVSGLACRVLSDDRAIVLDIASVRFLELPRNLFIRLT